VTILFILISIGEIINAKEKIKVAFADNTQDTIFSWEEFYDNTKRTGSRNP
jgi:hypothetical protein